MNWREIDDLATRIANGNRWPTNIVLREVCTATKMTRGQLLAWAIYQPDFDYQIALRTLAPQQADPGFVQAIKNRDPILEQSLRRAATTWINSYLAAYYRVSQHWVEAALEIFRIQPLKTYARTPVLTPGEIAFKNMTKVQKYQAVEAAVKGLPAYTPESVGIALGIPSRRVYLYAQDIACLAGTGAPKYVGERMQAREAKRRSTTAEDEALRERINDYSSVSEYAKAEGLSYPTAYRRAMRVGFTRIAHKGLDKLPWIETIKAELLATDNLPPKTTAQWVLTVDENVSQASRHSKQLATKALRQLGLEIKCLRPGLFVWVYPGQDTDQIDFSLTMKGEKDDVQDSAAERG